MSEKCYICGNLVEVIPSESLRETSCPICGGSKRNRDLANVIVDTFIGNDLSISEAALQLKDLHIFEAQCNGPINNILKKLPNYICSEYFDDVPSGSINKSGIKCEDLQKITFSENTFDLIITQDVLEHVSDPEKAFLEIHRVLKPDGLHIFTIPLHEGRKTVKRASINNQGNLINIFPEIYHGDPLRKEGALVYTDFGDDIIDFLESNNIPTEIALHTKFYDVDEMPNVNTQEGYEVYQQCYEEKNLLKYFKYNSVVFISRKSKVGDDKINNMLEWTGERFIPWMEGAQIHYEHIHRYAFASLFVKGKKVLDLACGEGYGSHALSKNAGYVVGVEIDENAVEHARNKYTTQNLEFIQGSILEIPIQGNEKFDVIVCFEGIEHVEEHEKLLSEVKRLLNKEGVFIVSSPNKKTYSDDIDFNNPFHKKELYFNDFRELLDNDFSSCIFFGQKVYSSSNIWSLPPYQYSDYKEFIIEKQDKEFYFSDIERKTPLYFIAIASDKKLNHQIYNIGSHLVDVSNILIGDFEKQVGMLTSTVGDKDKNITEINSALQARDTQVTELTSALQSRDTQVIELNGTLQARDAQITELTSALQIRDTQVIELNDTLQARDAQITEITSTLQVRDTQITELNDTLQARDAQITELNGAKQSKDGHILSLENEIHVMQQSIVWRLTMKFNNFFVERILPHETQRRRAYDFGLKGCRILVNDGGKSLWWNYRNYKNSKINLHKYKINSQSLNVKTHTNSENIKPIEKKVSVVIPTKNGGPDFEYTLEKIRSQDGIKEIETIIIDSGSLDDTVKLAEKFDATVYCIKPEDFNHGETRNYGAEKATGDYILFMVQDAIPIGDHWLYNMVKVLENDDEIAAVTCRQVPRSDADLFACFSLWNHYKALNFFEDRISSPTKNFSLLSPLDKRKLAGLENVSCLIKRNIFNDLKFEKIQYAEDLELGLRILDNKFKIAFLYSVGIIHSHNRIPSYFLKRAYVDNKVLPKILSYDPVFFTDCDINDVFNQITTLYAALNTSLKTLEALSFDGNDDIISKLKYLIEKNLNIDSFEQLEYSCNSLDELFIEIQKVLAPIEFKSNNLYVQSYFNLLDHLNNYIEKSNYNSMNTELIDSFYKLFAIVSGSAFANNYLFKSNNGEINENALIVDCILSEGL